MALKLEQKIGLKWPKKQPKSGPKFERDETSCQLYSPFPLRRFPQMWYLNRGDRIDMNVQGAWAEGVTGKGVSITILDDGVERSHPDLQAASWKILEFMIFVHSAPSGHFVRFCLFS